MFLLRLIFIALVPFVAEIMKKIFLLLLYVMISAGGIIEAQNVAVPVIVNRDSWDTEIEISYILCTGYIENCCNGCV